MSTRPFRHLCPEADMRDAMTDDEFWAHVAANLMPDQDDGDFEVDVAIADQPCAECGEVGACAYDSEGRAPIHAVAAEDDSP